MECHFTSDVGCSTSTKLDTSSNGRRRTTGIHWRGPVAMLGALLTAVLFALAHHFFYQYLDNRVVGSRFQSQTWVNNIATALAFLSKLMFVVASSIAYAQRQWFELSESDHKVKQVDTISGVLEDITLFIDFKTWLRRPVLLIMAVVTWALPISAIFTPGTLTVRTDKRDSVIDTQVPMTSYANLHAYVQTQHVSGYIAPSVELSRIAMASSTSGQILQIPSRYQNQSYSTSLTGPALRCEVRKDQGVFQVALRKGLLNDTTQDVFDVRTFISFVPGNDQGILGTNVTAAYYPDGTDGYATLDQTSNDTARLYVMPGPLTYDIKKAALLECQLYNATYNLDFQFAFPNQTVGVRSVEYLNPVNATMGYCPIAPGLQLCDSLKPHPYDHMAYQAIMDAFGTIIVGVERVTHKDPTIGYTQTFHTSRLLTSIDWNSTESARQGLEELFRNITLSTMSSYSMTERSDAKSTISVTVNVFPNVYEYKPRSLFLSYGLSLLFSLMCTMLGLHAMWLNNASYQNHFSSFIRAAWNRNPNIDVWIKENDYGTEPLPKEVAEARVRLHGNSSFFVMNMADSGIARPGVRGGKLLPVPSSHVTASMYLRSSTPSVDEEARLSDDR